MKDRKTLVKNKQTFCIFNGECDFKKILTKKSSQPESRYAICKWKDLCNQQINHTNQLVNFKEDSEDFTETKLALRVQYH